MPANADALVPAAQYLRMSTERQEYSLDNQKAAIRDYAEDHGFAVLRTYQDAGKSGLTINRRSGLKALLTDVINRTAGYRAVLVYDVSRWGRFQDADEAAHYEYLVKSTGIRVHYCAEQFGNDDSMTSHMMKALKRTMAAEFSRELGEKVFTGKRRLVELGFHVGGAAGYGLRRVMISSDGRVRQELRPGERKSLISDRVVLQPGTCEEIHWIRWIYRQFNHWRKIGQIVKALNAQHVPWLAGKRWTPYAVRQILTNPKYAGCNVWARATQKLRSKVRRNPPEQWITNQGAFEAIVDQRTFARAQRIMAEQTYRKTDEMLIQDLKRLWKRRGHLSEAMLDSALCVPSCGTLRGRFGTMAKVYNLIGFKPAPVHAARTNMREMTATLRRKVLQDVLQEFPNEARVVQRNTRCRELIAFAGLGHVGVLLCRSHRESQGLRYWNLYVRPAERTLPTLLCLLSPHNDAVQVMHLVPSIDALTKLKLTPTDPWFRRGVRLRSIADLRPALKQVRAWVPLGAISRGVSNATVQLMGPPARNRIHDHERNSRKKICAPLRA